MAERFKAPVLKTGEGSNLPWVRIPLSPPIHADFHVTAQHGEARFSCRGRRYRWRPLDIFVFPDDGVAMIVMTNLVGANPQNLIDTIAGNYIAEQPR